MKRIIKFIKRVTLYTAGALALAAIGYFGYNLYKGNTVESPRVETIIEQEIVTVDEFDALVEKYETSEEGKQVLNVWARQQAIAEQRAKLDQAEKALLTAEASL